MSTNTYVTGHEDGPEEDAEHEAVVLEMNVVHNQESGVQEQRGRDDPLNRRVHCASYKPADPIFSEHIREGRRTYSPLKC